MENEFQVLMSPVQLAAVLSDETVTQAETLQNRLLGGLGVAMGTVEMVGAGALCLAPEPTMLTKAGCVVVGAHSMDTLNTAIEQTITGKDTKTETYQLAESIATQLGADEETAWKVGLTVDIAVPIAFGLAMNVPRISYVRAGTFKLAEHEAVKGIKAGGHTIAKHVAVSEEDLLARLSRSPQLQSATSFFSLEQAEKVISAGLRANRLKIIHWANFARNSEATLDITYNANAVIGYGFRKGIANKENIYAVRIVLLKKIYNSKPYYLLTAYPFMG
jgi:hypothetical protein